MMLDPKNWFWIVNGDEARAFSSAVGAYVSAEQADPSRTTRGIDSEESMIAVLRDLNVPPYHRVPKSTIISRLTDAQLSAAAAVFNQPENLRLRERWYAPDQPAINANDPESIAFVLAIGADPEAILAPEA